jgi:hypothetical protein
MFTVYCYADTTSYFLSGDTPFAIYATLFIFFTYASRYLRYFADRRRDIFSTLFHGDSEPLLLLRRALPPFIVVFDIAITPDIVRYAPTFALFHGLVEYSMALNTQPFFEGH